MTGRILNWKCDPEFAKFPFLRFDRNFSSLGFYNIIT